MVSRRKSQAAAAYDPRTVKEHIVETPLGEEMSKSFLEYAYSVIYARALPDARDGLKPVQRRIIYQMGQMNLLPTRPYMKSARVVGEVMGKLHPHGDSAIYEAMVRLAQPFAMRLPLVDGHGNFGSLDDGPAASRYTEARLAPAALGMNGDIDEDTVDFTPNYDNKLKEPEVLPAAIPNLSRYTEARLAPAALGMNGDIDEDTVDFTPNYDNKLKEPEVLPAAIPNLLVNGASGIAVGMATNMATHNLGEVVAAAKHVMRHPGAGLDELMQYVPGPDWPGGGIVIGRANMATHNLGEVVAAAKHVMRHPGAGLDELMQYVPGPDWPGGGIVIGRAGIRDAYAQGRGSLTTRAATHVENVTARKKAIVVTELPYMVGPERVLERISEGVKNHKLEGISNAIDLTDRHNGTRIVIELKTGFDPAAVLSQLFKHTPLQENFTINNVALVDGRPHTMGLREMLDVWIEHRRGVIRRRSEFRRAKALERLHLVVGLLLALVDIDEVIQVIRSSEDAETAKTRLMQVFDLDEIQAQYILDLRLRRLTKMSRIELEAVIRSSEDAETAKTRLMQVFDLDEIQAQYILDLRLRRLTKMSRIELEAERDDLRRRIEELEAILASADSLDAVVIREMDDAVAAYGSPRRTVLLDENEDGSLTPVKTHGDDSLADFAQSAARGRIWLAAPHRAAR